MAATGLNVFRFGPPGRALFGILHAPDGAGALGHGVLLCNPFGQEAQRSHRLMRVLAERLAREGFHAMRFDYHGTGDSDGEDMEADFGQWASDIGLAHEELARRAGVRMRSWFGLRLGASAAALASGGAGSPPARLVLWDPVLDGTAYLAELAAAHRAETKVLHRLPRDAAPPMDPATVTELLGFPVTDAMRGAVLRLAPEALAAASAQSVTILESAGAQDTTGLVARIAAGGVPATRHSIGTRIVWASDEAMNTAIVPAEAMAAIAGALRGAS